MDHMTKNNRAACVTSLLLPVAFIILAQSVFAQGSTDNSPDWFYPEWASNTAFSKPVRVRDTESGLGRYARQTKEIGLKDLARIHGHLCDGLVIAFVELKATLGMLFPAGIVDRTDVRAVSKNGPCWVDAVTMMTGARINFKTLRIDASIGDGFIVQRISTGQAFDVRLRAGVFPKSQATLERKIRALRRDNQPVTSTDIGAYERMADALSRKLLTTPPDSLLIITAITDYRFRFNDLYDDRGDIINREIPR